MRFKHFIQQHLESLPIQIDTDNTFINGVYFSIGDYHFQFSDEQIEDALKQYENRVKLPLTKYLARNYKVRFYTDKRKDHWRIKITRPLTKNEYKSIVNSLTDIEGVSLSLEPVHIYSKNINQLIIRTNTQPSKILI